MTNLVADPSLGVWEACWRYLVLGVVQGITEFLPISSSAHLKVVPMVLGWGDPGVAVTAVIQLGSIVAVLAYFRRDLLEVGRAVLHASRRGDWQDPSARLGLAIGLGTNFFLYVFVNVAMVTGAIPVGGVPLPLISHGGSAMLTVMIGFGLLLSAYVHRDAELGPMRE